MTKNATRPTRDEVYDLLMNARQADWVDAAVTHDEHGTRSHQSDANSFENANRSDDQHDADTHQLLNLADRLHEALNPVDE